MIVDATQEAVTARIAAALQERAEAVDNVKVWKLRAAEALGVDARTFDTWLYGERAAHSGHLLRLFQHFGTGFVNEVLGLAGYVAARLDHAEAIEGANALARHQRAFTQIKGVIADAESAASLKAAGQ